MDCEMMPSPVKNLCDPPALAANPENPDMAGPPRWPNTHIGHGALSCRAVLEAGPLLTWLMTGCAALWREKYWSI